MLLKRPEIGNRRDQGTEVEAGRLSGLEFKGFFFSFWLIMLSTYMVTLEFVPSATPAICHDVYIPSWWIFFTLLAPCVSS